MADSYDRFPYVASSGTLTDGFYGCMNYAAIGTGTTLALSSANNIWAGSFIAKGTTLDKVAIYVSAVSGTLAASDLRVDIYADNTSAVGEPDESSSLANSTTLAGGAPTGAGLIEFTGLNVTLTPNRMYWAAIKNVNASPGTNNATLRWSANASGPTNLGLQNITWGWGKKHSTDGGSTWGTALSNVTGLRLYYSDLAAYDGAAFNTAGNDNAAGNRIYQTREAGSVFTTPSDVALRVIGGGFVMGKVGTPAGNLRFRLYTGTTPTLLGTTQDVPQASVTNGTLQFSYFASAQTLDPATEVRFTAGEASNNDANTTYYSAHRIVVPNDTVSKSLKPLGGGVSKVYYDGSTWTTTTEEYVPFFLILG